MANTGNKLTCTPSATEASTPHSAPGGRSRKMKFAGCCLMSDKQLEQHYKLYRLSDEELASVGLQRSSLIDDYRVLHEVSQLRQLELKRERGPHSAPMQVRALKLKELQLRLGIRPHKTYKFQLLNQLVRVMDIESDPSAIFPDPPFYFDALYVESLEVRMMGPKERERRRFNAFYDHLDNMFVNGDRNKAIDVVVDAFVRLKKRRMQLSQVPIPRGYMSPRSYDLVPRS